VYNLVRRSVPYEKQERWLRPVLQNAGEVGLPINLVELAMWEKRIQGVLYGRMSPSKDVPRLLKLYEAGQLMLDELITRTYRLEEINQGYEDLHAGLNMRGILQYDD
jgi:Zn-dependent alcohol dehydrogenase